jgi:CubicO group peptidase (beta-lactamase class C family)
MQERVFAPVGVTDTSFFPVTREDLQARLIDLNPSDPNGIGTAVLGGGGDMNTRSKGHFGGHGLFMTAPGYLKVLHSLLSNDGKILKPETVDRMFEHSLSPEAQKGLATAVAGPWGPFFRVGTAPDSKVSYGLGSLLSLHGVEGWYGEKTLSWGGGLTFCWFVDRANDLCGVGAFQATLPTDYEVITDLKQAFRHDIYRKRATWKAGQQSV